MKYIKQFENFEQQEGLIPGYMYKHNETDVAYIGFNEGHTYPVLCLLFHYEDKRKKFNFIEWIKLKNLIQPTNILIEDYMVRNNIIEKTLKSFKRPQFSSGGCKDSLEKIKEMKERLEAEDWEARILANKYNL